MLTTKKTVLYAVKNLTCSIVRDLNFSHNDFPKEPLFLTKKIPDTFMHISNGFRVSYNKDSSMFFMLSSFCIVKEKQNLNLQMGSKETFTVEKYVLSN